MRRSIFKTLAAAAIVSLAASPALAGSKPNIPSLPPASVLIGGCTNGFTNPDALDCQGYYTTNLLNNNDIGLQQAAIAALDGDFVWDGDWDSVLKIEAGPNVDPVDFGMTLFGLTIIGAHFGNAAETSENNVSVFWLIDFGTEGGTLTLADPQGWSNAVLYSTNGGPPVPEPATWAMMLLGFGAAGTAIRRSRRRTAHLAQLA